MKFGHAALSVAKLDKSIAFYRKYFGLRLAGRYAYKEKGLTIALLKGAFTLELFEFKKHKPLPLYRKALEADLHTLGVKHFSLEAGDIENVYKKFKKAKIALATDLLVFENGAKYFFFKDPDGILVEVMEAL